MSKMQSAAQVKFCEISVRLVFADGLRSYGRGCGYHAGRSYGKDDPKNDVSKSTRPGKKYRQEPQYPHDRGVKVKIVCEAGAHTRNLFVSARAHQLFLAARLRREAWRGSFRLFCAAVVAKLRTNSDVFLAVHASHWVTPTEPFFLAFLTVITQMGSKKLPRKIV